MILLRGFLVDVYSALQRYFFLPASFQNPLKPIDHLFVRIVKVIRHILYFLPDFHYLLFYLLCLDVLLLVNQFYLLLIQLLYFKYQVIDLLNDQLNLFGLLILFVSDAFLLELPQDGQFRGEEIV